MSNLSREINALAKKKGLDREEVISCLEIALTAAAIDKFGKKANVSAEYSEKTGELKLLRFWQVVAKVKSPGKEIDLQNARKNFDPKAEIGDEVALQIDHKDLGRKIKWYLEDFLSEAQDASERKITPGEIQSDQSNLPGNVSTVSPDHAKREAESNLSSKIDQDSFTTDHELEVPCRRNREYYPFQKAAIKFIHERNAVLLADDMGLGKTVTVIGAINLDKSLKRILIICPLSVKNVWRKELGKWMVRNLRVGEAVPDYCPARLFDIFIINYDIVHKYSEVLRSIDWDLIVLDEAHYIKSRRARRTRSIVGFFNRAFRRWTAAPIRARKKILLTGTPIMNRPAELWPLVSYLDDKHFGSYGDFVTKYCDVDPYDGDYCEEPKGHSNLSELNKLLRSTVMIRRRKKDVLPELPAKLRVIMEVPATTPGQKKAVLAFNKAWGQYENDITSLEERYRLAMTTRDESEYAKAVDRLQKAYNVAFFEMSSVRHEIGLQKVPLIIEHIGELLETGQKIVVFAHHVDVIQQIKDHFAHSVSITGKTPVEERAMIVERFQNDPNTRLFIGNIQAAGTGITLHASSTAVFAELDWVPANLNQAEDRLHRIGQSDNVLVHHIVFEGSLDARMAEVIVEKQDIIRRALD